MDLNTGGGELERGFFCSFLVSLGADVISRPWSGREKGFTPMVGEASTTPRPIGMVYVEIPVLAELSLVNAL